MKNLTKSEKNKTIEAIRVPHGYRDEYIDALEGYNKYVSNGIPRYSPSAQPSYWHQPQLSRICDDESQHYKAFSSITIKGTTTLCKTKVLTPYKEDRSWKPKRPRQIPVVVLAPNDDYSTIPAVPHAPEEPNTTTISNSSSILTEHTHRSKTVLLSQKTWRIGRKKANGVCLNAIKYLKTKLHGMYVSPSELAGKMVFCTISPGKRQSRAKHIAKIAKLRRFLKSLAEDDYEGQIGVAMRLAFAVDSKVPHYHLIFSLPQDVSQTTCRKISDSLFTVIDRRWRKLHKHGISKQSGWCLLETGEDVQRVIDYVCKEEANSGYVGSWGQTCFFYGTLPEPPAEVIELTPVQAKTVIGILLNVKRERVHPWKVNVIFIDVHPRLVLIALMLSGVALNPNILGRYRAPW